MPRRYGLAGVALVGLAHAVTAGEAAALPSEPAAAPERGNPGASAAAVPARGDPHQAAGWRFAQAASDQVEQLQRALNELGYGAGPVDGALGPSTRSAIRTYQADFGLPVTGEFSHDLLDHVQSMLARTADQSVVPPGAGGEAASGDLVVNVQAELRRRGYGIPVVSGEVDAATEAAIRAYQRDRGLPVTGEPSERLLADLRAAGTEGAGGADRELVRAIQRELQRRGYDIGAADGVVGPSTRDAIRTYQADAGLPITGEPSRSLLQALRPEGGAPPPAAAEAVGEGWPGGAESPGAEVVLDDSFADGDYTRDPPWTVHAGRFVVRDGALLSRVPVQPPAAAAGRRGDEGGEPGPEEFGVALLQGVLQEVIGAGGQGAGGAEGGTAPAARAEISTEAPIADAFHLRVDLSSHTDGGRIAFGPYRGAGRDGGYRLAYAPGERPSLQLLAASSGGGGVRVIASSDRVIDLGDGDVHAIVWRRSAEGAMTVSVDGREVIAVTDRGAGEPFDGFALTNAGGEYALHRVVAEVPG